jgi:endonuclease/exonuclease/phosphatase family metal-dependent hydrolase
MFRFFLLTFIFCNTISANTKVLSWNIQNFGLSKSDASIDFIANIMKTYDVILIQEVNASYSGPQAIARLVSRLKNLGSDWDYSISNPTIGKGIERYAYVWKKSVKLIGKPYLYTPLQFTVDREPYIATFVNKRDTFTLANVHLVPKHKHPELEIIQLYQLATLKNQHIVIAGDFNCPHFNNAFDKLYAYHFEHALNKTPTTLKMDQRNGSHLASIYDNFYFENKELTILEAKCIDFSSKLSSLKEARKISDHLPISISISLK